MANFDELKELGEVYSADVVIVGSGLSGITAALKIKQLNPEIDVLVLEKMYYGYNGKTTKAGHGCTHMTDEDDFDRFCEAAITENGYGLYLNDQEVLQMHAEEMKTCNFELEELGGVFAHNEDGSFHYHLEFPGKPTHSGNIDITLIVGLTQKALQQGVRIVERCYFTDFLTSNGNVVGAVGFNLDTTQFQIFRGKCFIQAGNEFNPVVRQLFYGPAVALASSYEAGAEIRNAEQSTNFDLCHRNTGNFMYGMHWVIINKKGENVFHKYHCTNYEEIDMQLMLGLLEEVKLGNYPFYVDFSQLPQTSQTEGEGFFQGMLMPNRLALDQFIFSQQPVDNRLSLPEVSMVTYVFNRGLRIDKDSKTTAGHLWATGGLTLAGSAFGGWVHGNGIGYPVRTALHAAKSIVSEIDEIEFSDIDIEQVKFFRDRIYEPYQWKGKELPYQVVHFLDRLVQMPENSMDRTEESIQNVLRILREERENMPQNVYVPKGDGHHLSKAVEARTMIDMLEATYMAVEARKESRGFQVRADYPNRDDANWLKWIIVSKGEDGKPKLSYERIPFEKESYRWKPEGWSEPGTA